MFVLSFGKRCRRFCDPSYFVTLFLGLLLFKHFFWGPCFFVAAMVTTTVAGVVIVFSRSQMVK